MRPVWLCRACGAEWPCASARLCLVARFGRDRLSLAVYLTVLMDRAYQDKARLNPHPGPDAAALYRRFLGWIRPMTARRTDPGSAEPPGSGGPAHRSGAPGPDGPR